MPKLISKKEKELKKEVEKMEKTDKPKEGDLYTGQRGNWKVLSVGDDKVRIENEETYDIAFLEKKDEKWLYRLLNKDNKKVTILSPNFDKLLGAVIKVYDEGGKIVDKANESRENKEIKESIKIKKSELRQIIIEEIKLLKEEESEAASQAEKLGLIYKGYGRWADPKTNKIVAVTKNGKLYKTSKAEPAKAPAEKPTEPPTKPEEKPEAPVASEPTKSAYTKPTPGKKTPDDADILIPGFGVVRHSLAKKHLAKKIEDLIQRAARGDFASIGRGNFEALANWWDTLSRHSGEEK